MWLCIGATICGIICLIFCVSEKNAKRLKIFENAAVVFLILAISCGVGTIISQDSPFEPVPQSNYLYYDKNTKVIYWDIPYKSSVYYSENGKLCRYVNGEIIEIEEG